MSEKLFAGPWVGEFGWALMSWQGYVRKIAQSKEFSEIVICSKAGSEALYSDFCTKFEPYSIRGIGSDCWHGMNGHTPFNPIDLPTIANLVNEKKAEGFHTLVPNRRYLAEEQQFIKYGTFDERLKTDIIIHARSRQYASGRNWSPENWKQLIAMLKEKGFVIGSVGMAGDVHELEVDKKFVGNLQESMNAMASTRLVIGPSSGPMHLASLCGAKHLVWTDNGPTCVGGTNKDRYERIWNPLDTPCRILTNSWQPSLDNVFKEIMAFI